MTSLLSTDWGSNSGESWTPAMKMVVSVPQMELGVKDMTRHGGKSDSVIGQRSSRPNCDEVDSDDGNGKCTIMYK